MATEFRRFGTLAVVGTTLLAVHFVLAGNSHAAEILLATGVAIAATLAGTRGMSSAGSKRRV